MRDHERRHLMFVGFLVVFSIPVVIAARIGGTPWWLIGVCFLAAALLQWAKRA